MVYHRFDRSRLILKPLSNRVHDLQLDTIVNLTPAGKVPPDMRIMAERIRNARADGSAVILMLGAHVLRAGVQRYLIDLLERGCVTCIAVNGACVIHDYEFALIGATTESVARYISEGQFGLWEETGAINSVITRAAETDMGLGEAVGKEILENDFPHKEISLFAAAYRLGIPITVHAGIGYDIVFEHAGCDGAAWGELSYRDFLTFTGAMERLEGGVVASFGSAVMAPEIFLKALAMVRNAAHQENREVRCFTTLVCDLAELPETYRQEPARGEAAYYFRPWKTLLVRTVADGGESFYIKGRHKDTIPQLWTALNPVMPPRVPGRKS